MRNAKEAKKHLDKIQQLMSQTKSPFEGMSKQEIIDKIRETREKLWREKLVARP